MKRTLIPIAMLMATPVVAEEAKTFTLDGEFGLILTTGNTETTSVSAGLTAKQELENWSNDYLVEGLYKKETNQVDGEDVDQVSAQKFFASAQGNYKLENPDHRLFGFASYEDDRLGAYKYQATLAAGWNQKVWQNEVSSFEYSVGPGYAFQETNEGEDADSFIVRGSAAYQWNISDTAKFTQTLSTEVGSDNTKSRAETALTAKINGSLSMKVALKLDHNTDVPDTRKNLDSETSVTLVYTFF